MSGTVRRKIENAKQNMVKNYATVTRELSRSQRNTNSAVVSSAAKYYETLKKLARQ